MNREQMTRAFFGVVIIVAMGMYPPWVTTSLVVPGAVSNIQPALTSQMIANSGGYGWLWDPPAFGVGTRPDVIRLSIQWFAVIALFGIWVAFGRNFPLNRQINDQRKEAEAE